MENIKESGAQSGSQRPFKVGDRVWSPHFGAGVVETIEMQRTYGVTVNFGKITSNFDKNGRFCIGDVDPTLYHCDDIISVPCMVIGLGSFRGVCGEFIVTEEVTHGKHERKRRTKRIAKTV